MAAFLLAEQEIYFTEESLTDRKTFRKKIEKIINWADKDLSLNEIIGKLKSEKIVRKEKLKELAGICHDDYFSQTGWQPGDTFNIAIGQGDNAYTVLQMADYMAVLGNGRSRGDSDRGSQWYIKGCGIRNGKTEQQRHRNI